MSALRTLLGRPDAPDPDLDRASPRAASIGPVLVITATLAIAACILIDGALVALIHPASALVPGVGDQAQGAKTLAYLISFAVLGPAALVLVPRGLDRVAAHPGGDRALATLAVLGPLTLMAALVLVRLAPKVGVHDGVRTLVAATLLWWIAGAVALVRAARGRSLGGLERLRAHTGLLAWASAALALAVVLAVTDLRGLVPGGLVLAGAVGAGLFALRGRSRRLAPSRLGLLVDGVVVVLLALAVPNVVVFHQAGIPNAFYPPGIIQFHQDWLLGPVNQLLGGGALLVNVPVSQYGVGFLYFLAGWFHLAPIGYGTYGLLDGLVTALFYIGAYWLLRVARVSRSLALAALALAVVAFVYHLYYGLGALPQQGPLRFGLPMAVIMAEVTGLRWPAAARPARVVALAALAVAAVWSLEMLAYTGVTYVAVVAFRVWLSPAWRWAEIARVFGVAVAVCVGAHVVLAALTLLGTGQLPDWGQYLTYVDALVLGKVKAGQISYGFAGWSPGLAVGAGSLVSSLVVALLMRRRPELVRADPVRFLALAGVSVYAVVLYSYTDNRSSTYLLPYVGLPLLIAVTLWLSLIDDPRVGLGARTRAFAAVLAVAVGGIMVAAAWPSVGTLFDQSALAHAYPGGGLGGALRRLWHSPPIDPRAPVGEALLDRYAPARKAIVLLPESPDLGTEILMRSERSNLFFIGDPKADGFIDASAWTGRIGHELAALHAGQRLLTDAAGLAVVRRLRGRPDDYAITPGLGLLNPQLDWILHQLDKRFLLVAIDRDPSGLIVVSLAAR